MILMILMMILKINNIPILMMTQLKLLVFKMNKNKRKLVKSYMILSKWNNNKIYLMILIENH